MVEVVGDLCGLPRGTAVLSPEEVFELLGVKRTAGYELLRSGRLPAKKLNGRWVIPTPMFLMWCLTADNGEPAPDHLKAVR